MEFYRIINDLSISRLFGLNICVLHLFVCYRRRHAANEYANNVANVANNVAERGVQKLDTVYNVVYITLLLIGVAW